MSQGRAIEIDSSIKKPSKKWNVKVLRPQGFPQTKFTGAIVMDSILNFNSRCPDLCYMYNLTCS